MVKALLILILSLFVTQTGGLRAQIGLPDRSTLTQLTIDELLDLGSEPTGWWAMGGMPWPIEELLKRDQDVVIQEAYRRLGTENLPVNTHAFIVHLLTAIDPPGLDERLAGLYPIMNARGRYEVLLRAWDSGHSVYAPLFDDMLRSAATDRLANETIVAAIYAIRSRDQTLLQLLNAYFGRLDPGEIENDDTRYLDGFPYSDVVVRSLRDIPGLVVLAKSALTSVQELNDSLPTDEERAMLTRMRIALEEPERRDFAVRPGLVTEFLDRLSAAYSSLNLEAPANAYQSLSISSDFGAADSSFQEVMAGVCNEENVRFYASSTKLSTWSIGVDSYNNYRVSRPCLAHSGILVHMDARYDGEASTLRLSMRAGSPIGWLNSGSNHFILDAITSGDTGEPMDLAVRGFRTLIAIELGDLRPEALGSITISGNLEYYIPTRLSIREFDVSGREAFTASQHLMTLRYSNETEELLIEWGMDTRCCASSKDVFLPDMSSGMVQVYDARNNIRTEVNRIGVSGNSANSVSMIGMNKRLPSQWEPARLVWISAPQMEKVSIPVVFENVRFIPAAEQP